MRLRLLGILSAVLLVAACATIPPSADDEKVLELIDLWNTLPATELVGQVGDPFLFGSQVLYSQSDVEAVLARAKANGLVLTAEIVGSSSAIVIDGTERFDVGVFADRLPPDARQILVASPAGTVSLIIGGESNGLPQLLGVQRSDS